MRCNAELTAQYPVEYTHSSLQPRVAIVLLKNLPCTFFDRMWDNPFGCGRPPRATYELLHSMQSCISDVIAWATANMLKLNDNKTELMLVTSKRTRHLHNLPTSITIDNAQIPFKQSVNNLGSTSDCHLTMNAHVSNIARTCYFELHRLASIPIFLTSTATATLVSAFALSRIDYCNSMLFGSTHDVTSHLQQIQSYTARVILRLPKSSNITTHSKTLHWLPVNVRSTYKIACLCYHCHSSNAPSYVTDMLQKKPIKLPQHSHQLTHHASSQ